MSELGKARVGDVMHRDVVTIDRNDKADHADALMEEHQIRHLPVLDDDGMLAGVVSRRDLFRGALASALGYGSRAQTRTLELLRVKDVMTNDPITTTPDAPLSEAASVMVERKIGCLPVLGSDGTLVGILTEGRLAELVAGGDRS